MNEGTMLDQLAAIKGSASNLSMRCKAALANRLRELHPQISWIAGFKDYVLNLTDNLLPGIVPDLYRIEYDGAAGGELRWVYSQGKMRPPKMHAAYSSSALVVNSFAPFKLRIADFMLCGTRDCSAFSFEVEVPTPLKGTPPHLDILAEMKNGSALAIESKCTEFLQRHRYAFVRGYDSVCWPNCVQSYVAVMQRLRSDPETYVYLDAAQLVKHAFGLSSRLPNREVQLVYLFWEPENAREHREFDQHRDEIRHFADGVNGSSVKILWKSYSELWREWIKSQKPWLQQHAERLRERYVVPV